MPERVRSIEEVAKDEQKRRELKKAKKATLAKVQEQMSSPESTASNENNSGAVA